MANVTIPLTSRPAAVTTYALNTGGFSFVNSRLQSGSTANNGSTSGYIKFNAIAGTVSVAAGVSSEGNYDYLSLHVSTSSTPPGRNGGNMANISGSTSGTYTYNITSAGMYYLHFVYAKDGSGTGGSDCAWLTQAIIPVDPNKSICGIGLSSQPTMPGGSSLTVGGFSFVNSRLQSGTTANNGQVSGYIKFNAVAGQVSANIGVSSESSYDYMSLHVSTSATPPGRKAGNMANISGSTSGTYTYNITTAGTYYLHFFYAKDSSGTSGSDCGWITYAEIPLKASGGSANVSGTWKQAEVWVNVSGTWKLAEPWVNSGGVWKQGQ